jgi:hypothetical protein
MIMNIFHVNRNAYESFQSCTQPKKDHGAPASLLEIEAKVSFETQNLKAFLKKTEGLCA